MLCSKGGCNILPLISLSTPHFILSYCLSHTTKVKHFLLLGASSTWLWMVLNGKQARKKSIQNTFLKLSVLPVDRIQKFHGLDVHSTVSMPLIS